MAQPVTQLNTNLFLWKQDGEMFGLVKQVCRAWDKCTFAFLARAALENRLNALAEYAQKKFERNYSLYIDTALCLMVEKQKVGEVIAKKLMEILSDKQLTEQQSARIVYIHSIIDNDLEKLKHAACDLQDSFAKADFALAFVLSPKDKDPYIVEKKLPDFAHDVKQLKDPIGAYKVAFYYSHDHARFFGFKRDENKAADLYETSAEAGLMMAQYHLAICYYLGKGRKLDEAKGEEWMKKAAEGGNLYAQTGLILKEFLAMMDVKGFLKSEFEKIFQLFLGQDWSELNKKLFEVWVYLDFKETQGNGASDVKVRAKAYPILKNISNGLTDDDKKLVKNSGNFGYVQGAVKEICGNYKGASFDYILPQTRSCPPAIERFGSLESED
jgi:hypothetical protein